MVALPARVPIVVFGDDWGRHVSTTQHLFRHLLDRHPIVWVNSFGHRAPRLTLYDARRAAGKVRDMLARTAVPTTAMDGPVPARIVAPRALPWHGNAQVRRFNSWSMVRDLRRALAAIAPGERPVVVTVTPIAADVIELLAPLASLYFCIDEYGELPGVDGTILAPFEHRLLDRVDAVIATARVLTVRKRSRSGATYYLPQGVNYGHFATPRPVPSALAALPRPIVGFAGGVSDCCDFDCIAAVARALPHASVVLVGPVTTTATASHALPANVHLLGSQPYAELPAWVQAFDVGIIPYVLNDWTRAVDPLKLLEYLAAGIPVVSTPLPEVEKYADVVGIGATPEEFAAAVRAALEQPDAQRDRRRAVANVNTWESRATRMCDILGEVAHARQACAHRQPA